MIGAVKIVSYICSVKKRMSRLSTFVGIRIRRWTDKFHRIIEFTE